ncbi:O-antigen translocase [Oryzicola mucosus]|uniref:O-antigen translocase n=1 Tax=Oryzicola mucosus TaxID=2767425 RepID=A0A8J6PVL4_9HYPH|nr:O-antigen translocase [Oryzicola mucosus]MBD0415651.1 O-antigen translocase [Oryzicola mucosus]
MTVQPVDDGRDIPARASRGSQSYTQILKSTAVIGGSSVITIGFAILRNKAMALLLGPEGVGLIGLYTSIADFAQTLASMGIQASGVRQIAEAAGTEDEARIAKTATTLRRVSFILGLVGALLLALFAFPIATLTFGNHTHAAGVVLLSAAVFFRVVSAGQTALIQGMRRISDLASLNILAALFSTVVGIPLIYLFGAEGIVPSLVLMAVISTGTSWWYARKVRLAPSPVGARETVSEANALLKMGVVFMASGLLTVGAAYAIRIIVLQQEGFAAAGLYQAAWALGGLYAGFILQAMGTDFYPRLTAAAHDDAECNRLVNEQIQVSILLAGPGVVGTLTLAPLVMTAFYSSAFQPAVDLLRWICLGMMLRAVAWPMGFIVLAKGARQIFFWTEVAAAAVHVGLVWLLIGPFGLPGAAMAFFGLYIWHGTVIYLLVRRLSGFRWSRFNLRLALIFVPAASMVFGGFMVLPFWSATALGLALSTATGLYALRELARLLPPDTFPAAIRPWMARLM